MPGPTLAALIVPALFALPAVLPAQPSAGPGGQAQMTYEAHQVPGAPHVAQHVCYAAPDENADASGNGGVSEGLAWNIH